MILVLIRTLGFKSLLAKTQFLGIFEQKMSAKGGGSTPMSETPFLPKILSIKGGEGTPLLDKIRKVVFDRLPKEANGSSHFKGVT